MISQRDYVIPGQYFSADYLRQTELDASKSFGTLFSLRSFPSKNATDSDVTHVGETDTSPVYRAMVREPQRYYRSLIVADSVTQETIIDVADVPSGHQIVVDYASIRTESTSGSAYLVNNDGSVVLSYLYITTKSTFVSGQVYVPIGANYGLYLVSTQGSKDLYVAITYHFELV